MLIKNSLKIITLTLSVLTFSQNSFSNETFLNGWEGYVHLEQAETKYKDKRGYFYKTIEKDTVHLTRYTGQQALDFIEEAPSNKPFCLSLSFSAPHAHDGAPEQYFWVHKRFKARGEGYPEVY